MSESKIGVFLCHCGDNIAGTVNIDELKDKLSKDPQLVVRDSMFLCSEAGQNHILETLDEEDIDRVVIASCSPKHHGEIFKNCIEKRLNPFMWEMANIREQCSWVHPDMAHGTRKAHALIRGAIEKVKHHEPIGSIEVPVNREVLVIGAGIAGMHASLEMADKDFKVYLVEKEAAIGGNMTRLGRTFPTDDCSMCTVSPIMNKVSSHPNIEIFTSSEVVERSGRPGDYRLTIKIHPRYVDVDKCTSCGLCTEKCPVTIPSKYDLGLSETKAIHTPFDQSVPNAAFIEEEFCLKLNEDRCGICQKVCPVDAIDFNQSTVLKEVRVGAIIVATGYEQMDLSGTEYNFEHPDVITGMELERMITPAGPTSGKIICPSDGRIPNKVTFIQCAGSRDRRHKEYCSNICCMYSIKNAMIVRAKIPDAEINMCYIDIRAGGRRYEEYYRKFREKNVRMILGRPSEIMDSPDGKLFFDVFDKATEKPLRIGSDLIVLATALEPSEGTRKMAEVLNIPYGFDDFLSPLHVKIAPVDTTTKGIFIAGTAQAPKSIQESIVDADAAASRATTLLKNDTATIDLTTAVIDPLKCTGCGLCEEACNYNAIIPDGNVFTVVDIACKGCGKCVSVCPEDAIEIRHLTREELRAQVDGILSVDPDSIIAYSTETCGYNAADIAGTNRMEYPPTVKMVKLPCAGRLGVDDLLYPFDKGAKGVLVFACPVGLCHYIDGTQTASEKVREAKRILDERGIDSNRLRFVEILTPAGGMYKKVCTEMSEFVFGRESQEVSP